MEVNFMGHFNCIDEYKRINIILDDKSIVKLANIKVKFTAIESIKRIRCVLSNEFIGLRFNTPTLIEDFKEGDFVKAHVKLEKYHIRSKMQDKFECKQDGIRFRLQTLEFLDGYEKKYVNELLV